MSFAEKDLENLIIDLISKKGFEYVNGDNLEKTNEEVLLIQDMQAYLKSRYKENEITDEEVSQIISSFQRISSADIYSANKAAYNMMVEGYNFKRNDRNKKDFYVQLFDFKKIDNNIFKVCNQVVIKGSQKRIPDTIIYINGIPVVVWEFKSTTREDATIYDAYTQIITRYSRDIPELFKYNAFVVISDGINSKMGTIFSDYEYFYAWRKVNDNDEETDGIESLYTIIDGLFTKERLLDVIHNFVYFPDESCDKEIKIVGNYPQYFSSRKLLNSILMHRKPEGDGKGGTYFGTTGCGKSYGMLFLTRLLMREIELASPTIILITDRTDLDDQLSENFTRSKKFIGDKEVLSIVSREDLKEKLQNKASGGVYLTTIQKFTEKLDLLSDRNNIICISDEAHRSQINLEEKRKITENEIISSYGYAKYLHDSLPNATYVGYTGTPIQETIDVFGNIVEEYTMRDSIKDGITVNLVYDGRFVKAVLDSDKMKEIEEYYKECLKNGANEYQVEESKKKSIGIKSIIGDHDILRKVATNFIEHYESRVNEKATVAGKCLFVCADRFIAYDFYNIVKEMRPDWVVPQKYSGDKKLSQEELNELKPMPKMKLVMTSGKDDPKELYELLGTDDDRKAAATEFKKINSNFKIAIVVDMWLTGFDVPFLDTIYIDKLLKQEHSIIQTISRVNRAYPGKYSGLIIDFIGIKTGIDYAMKKYAKFEDENFEGIDKAIAIVIDEIDVLDNMFYNFDSSKYYVGDNHEKLDTLNKAVEYIQRTKDLEKRFIESVNRLTKAFNMCNASKDFSKSVLDKVYYYKSIKSIIYKLTKGKAPDTQQMNKKVQEMVQEAIKSSNVEELFVTEKEFDTNMINLFSDEYIEKINQIKYPNTKFKILQQLLNQAITEFKKVNKIKALSFSERLQIIVDEYNLRSMNADEFTDLLDKVTEDLIDLMKDLNIEKQSFEGMGINYEEKAFYDILKVVENKFNFEYPEDKNINLSKQLYEKVTDISQYSNWQRRPDTKAKLKSDIMVLLWNDGFPPLPSQSNPEDYEKIYSDILEQTENFKKYYNE